MSHTYHPDVNIFQLIYFTENDRENLLTRNGEPQNQDTDGINGSVDDEPGPVQNA